MTTQYQHLKGVHIAGRGRYKKHGKITQPITMTVFKKAMEEGRFVAVRHRAFPPFIMHTACRQGEALKVMQKDCTVTQDSVIIDIGVRLKKFKSYRICPNCKDKNAKKAMFCKMCGADLTKVEISKVEAKAKVTPPLKISRKAPYAEEIVKAITTRTRDGRLFPFTHGTAYNIIERIGLHYPHLFRLSRITWFFHNGFTTDQVKSWTGLSLTALDFYVGLANLDKMGKAIGEKEEAEE